MHIYRQPAAKLGFKVALCERGFEVFGERKIGLGGTCLNRGCIPSKMLIHPAEVAQEIREANRYFLFPNDGSGTGSDKHGFGTQTHKVEFSRLVQHVENHVDGDSLSIVPGIDKNPNLTLFRGEVPCCTHWLSASGFLIKSMMDEHASKTKQHKLASQMQSKNSRTHCKGSLQILRHWLRQVNWSGQKEAFNSGARGSPRLLFRFSLFIR